MYIGFDVSQTGASKAGCGYFSHAIIEAMLELAPEHRYALFPSFGDFSFDLLMPIRNPYLGRNVHYGPWHVSRETGRVLWTQRDVEVLLGRPDVVHANNFWCPLQFASTRAIYTFYDMGFTIDPDWTVSRGKISADVLRRMLAIWRWGKRQCHWYWWAVTAG